MDDRRERILVAARKVLAEKTQAGATVAEIAREAGVARGLLHYHFESKETLFLEVIRSIYATDLGPDVLRGFTAETPAQLATQITQVLREAVAESPWLLQLIYECESVGRRSAAARIELERLWSESREKMVDELESLRASGCIRSTLPSEGLVTMVVAIVHGIGMQMLGEPREVTRTENWQAMERTLELLFDS